MTIFWIGIGLMLTCLIFSALIPDEGTITICSKENGVTVWLCKDKELINTYLLDYGNVVSVKIQPGQYRCEYKTASRQGVIEVDLKKRELIRVQIPPV